MKTIAFCNQKGGVAKTTSTYALASGLAKKKYSVLMIDSDPQENLSQAAGIDLYNIPAATLSDVFKTEKGESVRKDASFNKQYLEGKYGADPYLKKLIDWSVI